MNWGLKDWLMLGSVVLWLGILVLGFRWTLSYDFDPVYWEDYYYHSQWNIPESTRVIGDEGVYRYVGYELVAGANPFDIDYWVPPLGKYLYGLTAHSGNPYWTSWGLYFASVGLFAHLVWKLVSTFRGRWLAVYLFALNPMLVLQIQHTMLDLPQLVALLGFMLAIIWFVDRKQGIWLGLAGLCLGLFAGIKPGLFVPWFWLTGVYVIWQMRQWREIGWYLLGPVLGYMGSYFMYFWAHQNPVPWIRLHKKVLNFYLGNGGSHDSLNVWRVLLTGRYRGFWEGAGWFRVKEWSLLMPAFVVMLGWRLVDWWSGSVSIKLVDRWLLLMVSGYLGMLMMIDFYPRYLLLLLPMAVLLLVRWLERYWWSLVALLITYLAILMSVLYPLPIEMITQVGQELEIGAYKELAVSMDPRVLPASGWEQFVSQQQLERTEALVTRMEVAVDSANWNWKMHDVPVTYRVQIESLYGEQSVVLPVVLDRYQNRWVIAELATMQVEQQRLPQGRHIWLVPHHVQDWNSEAMYLSELTGIPQSVVLERMRAEVPDWRGVYIGPVVDDLDEEVWQGLVNDSKYEVREWE